MNRRHFMMLLGAVVGAAALPALPQANTVAHVQAKDATCGFVPPTPGYAPCPRKKNHFGPCAHHRYWYIAEPTKVSFFIMADDGPLAEYEGLTPGKTYNFGVFGEHSLLTDYGQVTTPTQGRVMGFPEYL